MVETRSQSTSTSVRCGVTTSHTKLFRLIVRVSNCGPEGQPFAPDFRTVVIESDALAQALKCGTYSHAAVIGAEAVTDEEQNHG